MSVTVSMPQLGESVTEGTVTRWLKKEGERVEADEPLLEVSTDKVDTEIPSPASGILRGITVAEDETVAVGAQLATIDDAADGAEAAPDGQAQAADDGQAQAAEPAPAPEAPQQPPQSAAPGGPEPGGYPYAVPEPAPPPQAPQQQEYAQPAASQAPAARAEPQYRPAVPQVSAEYSAPYGQGPEAGYAAPPADAYAQQQAYAPSAPAQQTPAQQPPDQQAPPAQQAPDQQALPAQQAPEPPAPAPPAQASPSAEPAAPAEPDAQAGTAEGPYITPLVRKLAAEHGVNLANVAGTGVGGRIRKQDVLEAARVLREQPAAQGPSAAAADGQAAAPAAAPPLAPPARPIVPSTLRGTTERLSRARQLIARRMVESLQTSAQLTTVVEADVTAIARLRQRAKVDFEAREGVKLSYLPFFALAALEALKVHPKLNAVVNTEAGQIIYHDGEHLGVAVDTERGLMVPVIRNAGDLNIGGLARKIADLAARTRAGQVSPDELAGGTFTITNTGSRGALFDTPIINQPQVAILGTGTVVKRPVVMEDPALGEVITVRSMIYLALTYDHRLIDGADAARFLTTIKDRLEEGAFEAELGL
jgi:2-oxoglutarate dehydrogenase E2 component (dihydrolipoamide succinyltransferase)